MMEGARMISLKLERCGGGAADPGGRVAPGGAVAALPPPLTRQVSSMGGEKSLITKLGLVDC